MKTCRNGMVCAHKSRTNKIQNKYFARKITINSLCPHSPKKHPTYSNTACASYICVPTPRVHALARMCRMDICRYIKCSLVYIKHKCSATNK